MLDYFRNRISEALEVLMRRKTTGHHYSKLGRILNLSDITQISIGSAFGVGPFVMVGRCATLMGPGMVLAHVFAAVAAFLSAMSYAELMSRGGGSGGAYTCLYQYVGEFPAVISGYLIFYQNLLGAALSTRALADMTDYYFDNVISAWKEENLFKFRTPLLAKYPSPLAFTISIFLTLINTYVVKEVTKIHNLFVVIGLILMILLIVVNGAIADWKYWTLPKSEGCGKGGFLPYGMSSVLDSTEMVFLSYLGFDAAPHAAAECREPERLIPLAMLVSNAVVTVLYILQAITHTLVWPYCKQGSMSIVHVMQQRGISLMYWVSLFGMPMVIVGSILATSFPLSRIMYAIAEDGLVYSFMAKVNIHSRIPVSAFLTSGVLTGVVSFLLGEMELVELTGLCSMASYMFIALNVIHLGYTDIHLEEDVKRPLMRTLFNMEPKKTSPSRVTSKIVSWCCVLLVVVSYLSCTFLHYYSREYGSWTLTFLIICVFILIYAVIVAQPKSQYLLSFKVKPYPLIPFLCVIINIYMSVTLTKWTWARFGILCGFALFIYFSYGVRNSKLNTIDDQYFH